LLLLRHGQTALSVERRYSGHGDPPLTPYGLAQAAALADRVGALDVDAVWTSPLARARSTAEAVAGRLGLDVVVEERLRETNFGAWEGLTYAEIQRTWADAYAAWLGDPSVPAPEGESFDQVGRRVRQARDAVLAAHPGGTVAVVSHVTPIKVLLKLALEAPQVLFRLNLDLASITHVEWFPDGGAVVRRVNDTAHCEALPPAG
jgi:probable phosphoglycerate mutase